MALRMHRKRCIALAVSVVQGASTDLRKLNIVLRMHRFCFYDAVKNKDGFLPNPFPHLNS